MGHKDVKIFNKVLKLTQLLSIFMGDLGWSIWDDLIGIEILRFFYLLWFTWTLRNEKSNLPHQKRNRTKPNHSLRLPRIELHNPKVWSQNCLFQKYKTRDWLNNILWCNTQCYFSCSQKDKWVIISSPIHLILEFSNLIQNQFDLFLHFHRFHQQLDPHMGQELNQRDMNQLDDPQTSFHQYVLV